jgi:hypothetical protein
MESVPNPHPSEQPPRADDWIDRLRRFLKEYAWFIVRNILGWILMLAALPIGFALPGPFGFPIFLVGFALVTFPGKRRLTARVLRGRRLHIEDRAYAIVAGIVSILIPGIAFWIIAVQFKYEERIRHIIATYAPKKGVWVLSVIIAVLLVWLVTRVSLKMLNGLLLLLPRFRRKFRPWLQKKGLKLLPPRRRRALEEVLPEDEILELDQSHRKTLNAAWARSRPWLKRAAAVAITGWIFGIMIRPLRHNWPVVRQDIGSLSLWRFALASAMFAAFLLCFRALAWRRVLKSFGYRLPHGAATRIWSTSEMARYLPGAIWQVIGRVYLAKPYGVPSEITSTSQILEVFIFLFANTLVAGSCLLYFGAKMDSHARPWLMVALVLVPTLAMLLHPKIFYGAANLILRRVNKGPIVKRLRGVKLVELLFWMILGLLWQSVAVYLIVDPVLHFHRDWWWVMAGAYCLAWCAGFLAFWAPGGIGIRELVFVATMQAILPHQVRAQFPNPAALSGLLVLLGFVLRLWTVTGEVMLVTIAHIWDWRAVVGRPDAPGRVALESSTAAPPQRPEPWRVEVRARDDENVPS